MQIDPFRRFRIRGDVSDKSIANLVGEVIKIDAWENTFRVRYAKTWKDLNNDIDVGIGTFPLLDVENEGAYSDWFIWEPAQEANWYEAFRRNRDKLLAYIFGTTI